MAKKVKSKPCWYDGLYFESEHERNVYIMLAQDSEIIIPQFEFDMNPRFELRLSIEGKPRRISTVRHRVHKMDFIVKRADGWHAIEAKGQSLPMWTLKRDIFMWLYIQSQTPVMIEGVPTVLKSYEVIYMDKPKFVYAHYEGGKKSL